MLSRLTLSVSQACNLRCTYCYADGGGYGMPSRLMTPQAARAAVARVAESHPDIDAIQFFGGEPLTNLAAMSAAAEAARDLVDMGTLSALPAFSLVTNLTPLDDRALDFLAAWNVHSVVSLDGPSAIHDALRPDAKGRGTHAKIAANLGRLRARGLGFDLVTTYTTHHWRGGYEVYDLLAYLTDFGARRVDVVNAAVAGHPELDPTLSPDWPDILDAHVAAIERVLDGLAGGRVIPYGLVYDLMGRLGGAERPTPDALCPAGRTNLAIAADGAAYPCHMMIGTPLTCAVGPEKEGGDVRRDGTAGCPSKAGFDACRACWARPWCTMCLGKLYIHRVTDGARPEPVTALCDFSKSTLATLFARLPAVAEQVRAATGTRGTAGTIRRSGPSCVR